MCLHAFRGCSPKQTKPGLSNFKYFFVLIQYTGNMVLLSFDLVYVTDLDEMSCRVFFDISVFVFT